MMHTNTRTKIVCTLGPASRSAAVIRRMIENGMRIARLNFSHGIHAEHAEVFNTVRRVSDEAQIPVAILQDLSGPKIRVGRLPPEGVRLKPGQKVILSGKADAAAGEIPISYGGLAADVRKGDCILLADGLMELIVSKTNSRQVVCTVVNGGVLTSHKGINLPTGTLKTEALTAKDRKDLAFGLSLGVDYVAMSFVRTGQEVEALKKLIEQAGHDTPVIAKIEKHEAMGNLAEIIATADAIMVARGDLGVEIPPEQVPAIQKKAVKLGNEAGKPVIIATQMLRSMVNSPRPSRAEATDVANAVLDGADAIMLSEESAVGKYPVEAVAFMRRIAGYAEKDFTSDYHAKRDFIKNVPKSVAHAACVLARNLEAVAIVAPTLSGFTAAQLCRYRPEAMVLALSPKVETVRKLALYRGCIAHTFPAVGTIDEMIQSASEAALALKIARPGDIVIITAGHPVWVAGTTKIIRVKEL